MKSRAVDLWIQEHLQRQPVRAKSLIVTVFGDLVAPHGGRLWLGSLIRLVEAFGISERLVRTSVFRLAQEQWLSAQQHGRRSDYSITAAGRRRFERADRRIYFGPDEHWAGQWLLVVLPASLASERREALRKELSWAGYGSLASGVCAHPTPDREALEDILQASGVRDQVVTMQAAHDGANGSQALLHLVHACWNLQALAAEYDEFRRGFEPVLRALQGAPEVDPEQAFAVQTLLMHGFRRTLLDDPQLPGQLLPADWSGRAARSLCRDIYRLTCSGAQQHLRAVCQTADGPLPAAAPYFHQRFGGLPAAAADRSAAATATA